MSLFVRAGRSGNDSNTINVCLFSIISFSILDCSFCVDFGFPADVPCFASFFKSSDGHSEAHLISDSELFIGEADAP